MHGYNRKHIQGQAYLQIRVEVTLGLLDLGIEKPGVNAKLYSEIEGVGIRSRASKFLGDSLASGNHASFIR